MKKKSSKNNIEIVENFKNKKNKDIDEIKRKSKKKIDIDRIINR